MYLLTTPSTMKWFCDTECDYEMMPYGGEQIKVCSDCENMWRVPTESNGKQTLCVASCFQSKKLCRADDGSRTCIQTNNRELYVESITAEYKGNQIPDKQCVQRCTSGMYAIVDGENQCVDSCQPPLVGSPKNGQIFCTDECDSGFAIDKRDSSLWMCDNTCDYVKFEYEPPECAFPCPDSRPYRQPPELSKTAGDSESAAKGAQCLAACDLKMFETVNGVRTCVTCGPMQFLVAQPDRQYECTNSCMGFNYTVYVDHKSGAQLKRSECVETCEAPQVIKPGKFGELRECADSCGS